MKDYAEKYITEKELSEIISIAPQTLRNWRHQGYGPPYIKVGRRVLYKLSDVIRFMDENKRVPVRGVAHDARI
ncbi:MAG: helix-turn-helix domain-containing protein [Candidatus Methanomethylicaceae archaeon]